MATLNPFDMLDDDAGDVNIEAAAAAAPKPAAAKPAAAPAAKGEH